MFVSRVVSGGRTGGRHTLTAVSTGAAVTARALVVLITVCLLLAGLEVVDRSTASAATQSAANTLMAPQDGENLVRNSAFNKGRKGWLQGRGTAFAVRRAGLARSNGARLTTTRRAQALLRSALSDQKAINTGDLFTASAAVRSARGKRHGWLVVRLLDGTHGWTV